MLFIEGSEARSNLAAQDISWSRHFLKVHLGVYLYLQVYNYICSRENLGTGTGTGYRAQSRSRSQSFLVPTFGPNVCLILGHGPGPKNGPGPSPGTGTGPKLVPVLGPGPVSSHISGPGLGSGPGPVIVMVPAVVPDPLLVKISGPVTQWSAGIQLYLQV